MTRSISARSIRTVTDPEPSPATRPTPPDSVTESFRKPEPIRDPTRATRRPITPVTRRTKSSTAFRVRADTYSQPPRSSNRHRHARASRRPPLARSRSRNGGRSRHDHRRRQILHAQTLESLFSPSRLEPQPSVLNGRTEPEANVAHAEEKEDADDDHDGLDGFLLFALVAFVVG